MEKNWVTEDRIINNTPIEVEVPGVGYVKYRMPTREDRIASEKLARKHPFWNELTELEKTNERTGCLVLQVLVEPKITYEKYKKARDDLMEAIIQIVSIDIVNKTEAIRDKRQSIINDFLERMKVRAPGISTGSSSSATSTGS